MKRTVPIVVLAFGLLIVLGATAWAQDRVDVLARYLRTDIAAKKSDVMTSALLLTPDQEKAFWPVYNNFQRELAEFSTGREALIKDYVLAYKTLDDAKAKDLMDRAFELNEKRFALLRKYAAEMQKSIPIKEVVKFVQVEAQLHRLMDLQINMELPQLR